MTHLPIGYTHSRLETIVTRESAYRIVTAVADIAYAVVAARAKLVHLTIAIVKLIIIFVGVFITLVNI